MTAAEHCDWVIQENRTEPRVTEQLDAAGCLFLSILPDRQAVFALIWLFVLLTIFSFLINGLTLFGLGRSEDLSWEPRVTFFRNLIVSDLLQTTTIGPTVIYSLIQRRTIAFGTWCHVQYFVGTVGIFSSLLTITCIALERYIYVCHAIHYLVIVTRVRLRLVLSLIWTYSVSVSTISMVLLYSGREQEREQVTRGLLCEPDMMEQHMGFTRSFAIFRKLVGSFTLLLCLLVYAFSYLRMYQDARNAVMAFNAVNTTARRTVLYYCGMLMVQLLPVLFKTGSDALWEVEGTTAMMALSKPTLSTTAAMLHMSFLVLLLVPPSINPLVFVLRNAETRQMLPSLLRRMERRRARARAAEEMRLGNIVPPNRAQAG